MLDQLNQSMAYIVIHTQQNLPTLLAILAVLFGVFLLTRLDRNLLALGIQPRRLFGLLGIIFAPFLHANFNHLFFNAIPLLVLSDFLMMDGLFYFYFVTVAITLLSGFLIWCFGKPALYIGASAVITGYWALLVMDIVRQGTLTAMILGIITIYYFAGIFFSIFPQQKGVAWEGHLFGMLSGFAVGYAIRVM